MSDVLENKEEIEKIIDYHFRNQDLLQQAFIRKSYSEENGGENNETLEFIGDRVLDYFVTKIIIDTYGYFMSDLSNYNPREDWNEFAVDRFDNEGKLTNIKKKFVNKNMLSKIIFESGLNEYLIMSKGDQKQEKQYEDSVMEDLFESILGAVAVDSDWNPKILEDFVRYMLNMDYYLDHGFNDNDSNYVSLLQQWCQKEYGELPKYNFSNYFYIANYIKAELIIVVGNGTHYFSAVGNNKVEARAKVAQQAYEYLEKNDLIWTIMDELPEHVTTDNSINTLQELAQKEYISFPEYSFDDEQKTDSDDELPRWGCTVYVNSENLVLKGYSTTKKDAKKYAAYLAICQICNLENEYK